jgi:Domain of unknown function (DUF222)
VVGSTLLVMARGRDRFLVDGTGATGAGGSARAVELALEIRAKSLEIAAAEAARLRLLGWFTEEVSVEAGLMLSMEGRGPTPPEELVRSAVIGEIQAVLGISAHTAERSMDLAGRLRAVLPETLHALETGRLDLIRARELCEATEVLTEQKARDVQDQLLGAAGPAPWEGLSPRAWRARIARAVIRADVAGARERAQEEHAKRLVHARATDYGMGEFLVVASVADVAMAYQVLTDLANTRPETSADGERVSIDQRRVDAFVEVFQRLRDGEPLPGVPVRRERELGLVVHADTFFGDGPAANDPGQERGVPGAPEPVDPLTARERAHADASTGTTKVFLVDATGALQRMIRLPTAPPGGWTRQLLGEAIQARLDTLPALQCESYTPTVVIQDHVRARNPRCTAYDCPRPAARCDLDHDTPWPRGPTAADNLAPRSRRHHEIKTRGLVRTRLHHDGSVDHTMLTGLTHTTRPEPLPGYAPGEGYGPSDGHGPGEGHAPETVACA